MDNGVSRGQTACSSCRDVVVFFFNWIWYGEKDNYRLLQTLVYNITRIW